MLGDSITARELLFDSAAIAAKARVSGEFRHLELDGEKRLVVHAGATVRLKIPRQRSDLSAFNTLIVTLRPMSHFKCALITTLRHNSRSSGMSENDNHVSVLHFHQQRKWTNWTRAIQPSENLVAVGFPDGWRDVESLELRFNSRYAASSREACEIAIGDIELLHVEKPTGSRMSDEELFCRKLDLDRPDMQSVARLVKNGDFDSDRAIKALAAIVRKQKLPESGPRTWNRHYPESSANDILKGRIMGQSLGSGSFDWRINPIGYLEWNHAFNRHTWMSELSRAVIESRGTARRRYARKLDSLIASWIRQCPEPVGHNGGLDPAWETLSTSCRINWAWPGILAAAAKSRDFSDRTLVEMLKSIHGHAEHMLAYHGDCNWYVSESAAIMTCAAIAPFFKRADYWAAQSRKRLESEMRKQVFADGVQYELSPGYHMMCADLLLRAWLSNEFRIAQHGHNGAGGSSGSSENFSRGYMKRLEGMFDYRLLISRPNGTIAVPNDAGCNSSVGPDSPDAKLEWASRLLKRPEWRWAGGAAKSPERLSVHFPDAGYAVMRSGWKKSDMWAFMDAANLGSAHQHEDKLQVELYAYGQTFLMDAGIQSYQHDPLVEHCRRADSHNTIMIDGCGQDRRSSGNYAKFEASVRGENFWVSGDGLDVFSGSYDEQFAAAIGKKKVNGLRHTRTLVFVKNDYWLILDSITGSGRHLVEALWHFAPMHLRCDKANGIFRTQRIGFSNMELICRGGWSGGDFNIVTGRDEPPQGFIAIDGEMKPAPCAIISRKTKLPLHGVVVAAPYESGTSSDLDVNCRDIATSSGGSDAMHISVSGPKGIDEFIWSHSAHSQVSAEGIKCKGRLAAVRRDSSGKIFYAALCDGQKLDVECQNLSGAVGTIREFSI